MKLKKVISIIFICFFILICCCSCGKKKTASWNEANLPFPDSTGIEYPVDIDSSIVK